MHKQEHCNQPQAAAHWHLLGSVIAVGHVSNMHLVLQYNHYCPEVNIWDRAYLFVMMHTGYNHLYSYSALQYTGAALTASRKRF